ncbi:hypothetical protein Tco_0749706 [Tanacetum coccineum]|uniref:Uncharacterized protein n=1 Tax=Tanacetum coccineum TaxID=301880 RepID=A0ABQ4Z068_9ASTR
MANNRTMPKMLQAPIKGNEDAKVVPDQSIANNFELKTTFNIKSWCQTASLFEEKMTNKMKPNDESKEMPIDVYNTSPVKAVKEQNQSKPKKRSQAITTRMLFHTMYLPITTNSGGRKESEVNKDTERNRQHEVIQPPPLIHEQTKDEEPIEEPSFIANKAKPNLPYPSRLNKEKIREKDDILASR